MTKNIQDVRLHFVVQFGGTSREQYLHAFTNRKAAKTYMRNAKKASYQSIGPFSVTLPGIKELYAATKALTASAEAKQIGTTDCFLKAKAALAEVQREFQLN